MKDKIIIIVFLANIMIANSQILVDSLTQKRDIVLSKFNISNKEYRFKRVLIPSDKIYSIRKGREILILIDEHDNIVFKFEEIDGYTSLYLEYAIFNKIKIKNRELLVIETSPFESLNQIWFYEVLGNGKLKFIDVIQADEYKIINNEIYARVKNVICKDFFCANYNFALQHIDSEELYTINFYILKDSILLNNNAKHKKFFIQRIEKFKLINNEVKKLKFNAELEWIHNEIDLLESRINNIILNYKRDIETIK